MAQTEEIAIIGGGPAGLMAAEMCAMRGASVTVYEQKPTLARKLLMAGKSGLNITHSEGYEQFLARFGASEEKLRPLIDAFPPSDICDWMDDLDTNWFRGSTGRVFPDAMKSSPLLRRWLLRLHGLGITIRTRHKWQGWDDDGHLQFDHEGVSRTHQAKAVILALGGASWPRLGSDGMWATLLSERGVDLAPFEPSNVGFDVAWSEHFAIKFAGQPIKSIALEAGDIRVRGEFVATKTGVEGGGIYAVSSALVAQFSKTGQANLKIDLLPDVPLQRVFEKLLRPRNGQSMANHLRKNLRISGAKAGLLRENITPETLQDAEQLSHRIKSLPLALSAPRPIAEAISTAGGVAWAALDDNLMLQKLPGVFCAGEMLAWDAPTGGYLITACLATGRAAGIAAAKYVV